MKRKVKRTLAFLLALTLMVSFMGKDRLFVAAESAAAETVSTEETEQGGSVHETVSVSEEQALEEEMLTSDMAQEGVTEEQAQETTTVETQTGTTSEASSEETSSAEPTATEESPTVESAQESEESDEEETTTQETDTEESEEVTEETSETEITGEEAEAAEEKPEFTYCETVDGVEVRIHAAEGILPKGTTVTIEPLDDHVIKNATQSINEKLEEKEVVQIIGFDICFFDPDGNELHDLEGAVEIEYSGMDILDTAAEAQVYHADEDGNITHTLTEAAAPSEAVEFSSDQFSPVLYAVTADTRAAGNRTAVIDATIQNGQVAYFYYNSRTNLSGISESNLIPIYDGNTATIPDFNSTQRAGYLLFFVKPDDNYLLTGLGASGNGDIYNIDGPYGNIAGYPNLSRITAIAKAAGYVGVFGYSRGTSDSNGVDATFEVNCQSPDITVEAISSKAENVKPGDELTFTVTITPGLTGSGKDTVSGVAVNAITINGQEVAYSEIRDNGDGTYTTQVTYTATADDCASGSVQLDVTTSVSYDGTLGVSDGQTISSTATIVKSATATCLIAPQNQVTYRHTYEIPDGETITEYPDEIISNPVDRNSYYAGSWVTVDTTIPDGKEVEDLINGGVWKFDGWYLNGEKVQGALMTADGLVFTGKWIFIPKICDVVVEKVVAGNMGDRDKKFTFAAELSNAKGTVDLGDDASFILSHNGQRSIQNLRAGTILKITESKTDGYKTSVTVFVNGEKTETLASGNEISVRVQEGMKIVFTNTKDVVIDTGVGLDSLPYVFILAMAVAGGLAFFLRKRRNRNYN